MSSPSIRRFYDDFSRKLLQDFLFGNRRVDAQLEFLADAVWPTAESILVLGCGIGQVASHLAKRVAPAARIMAVDLSSECIAIARALYPHRRVRYEQRDILEDPIEGTFEVVVLPDVYEHIPMDKRPALHERLRYWLTPHGRILLTLPSPSHQAMLAELGTGLQIVDETVTLGDLISLADKVGGSLTYFALVSIFHSNDYIHAVVERNAGSSAPVGPMDRVVTKRQRSPLGAGIRLLTGRNGLLWYPWRLARLAWATIRRRRAERSQSAADEVN